MNNSLDIDARLPKGKMIAEVASHLEVMGDPTRLKILYVLSEGEVSVSNLADITGYTPPAVSHHLRILLNKGLVRKRKEGIQVFYRLVDSCILDVLSIARNHVEEQHVR